VTTPTPDKDTGLRKDYLMLCLRGVEASEDCTFVKINEEGF
jgi:hypothetical protein